MRLSRVASAFRGEHDLVGQLLDGDVDVLQPQLVCVKPLPEIHVLYLSKALIS